MMLGIDEALSDAAAGRGAVLATAIAFVLGLRHASDPDHLVAVSTLVAGLREHATRAAALLGAAWGAGHATTLVAAGVPVLLIQARLPATVETLAEALIGTIIVILAVSLLVRWRRGAYHTHAHEHSGVRHAHVHSHAHEAEHLHTHPVRSPAGAFSIGLVHGLAGSGSVAVLLVASIPDKTVAVVALLVLAAGSLISMTVISALFGRALTTASARRTLSRAIPVLGVAACAFGLSYLADALTRV